MPESVARESRHSGETPAGVSQTVVARILGNADTFSNSLAVRCGDSRLTYRELRNYTDLIAGELIQAGVQRGACVGVCIERSVLVSPVLLAVLRIGAAYVPLDPAYPPSRLEYMIRHARLATIVSDRSSMSALPTELAGACLLVDELTAVETSPGKLPDRDWPESTDLAYVIFTSGSTGNPKGVMVEHGSLLNLIASMSAGPAGVSASDVMLSVAPLSFDMSVPDMFLPLYSGGSLVIATNDEVRQPERIADLIRDREITLLQATPTVWRMILDSGWSGSPNLRAICGGEALDGVLRDRLALACKEAWNYYGPTEATVWCAAGQMIETRQPVTVGQAIAGMQLSVRDGDERPCAAGQAGELYIAGPGLARGYLGDSEQTAERFVHVQGDAESSRLYRSGDRAVCHANGEIEVLGRTDQQFKLRGYRIEAGEIEATAREHDKVSDVAVTQFMHESGKRMLVAWVQAKGGANLEHELRTYLVSRLPAFMIPARVVVLPELPRSPAGKVDRLALGKLGLPHHESALDTLPDWHPVARQLTALWRNILCLESVGPDEDFFELGGDSLQSLKLLAGIKDMTGRNLGIADLYAHATIRSLTELLDKGQEAGGLRALVPIRSVGSKTPIFFVHGQPYALAPYLEPDRPVYALHYYTHRRFEFENTVEAIADLYLGELRLVQPKGPYMLCGYCFGSMIVFEMARRLQAAGERVEWLGMIEPALLPALEHPWAKIRYVMALLPDRRFSFRNLLFLADRCTRSLAGRAMAVRRRIALVLSNWGARAPTSAARTAAILDRVTVARMGYHFEPLGIDGHLLMLDIDSREAERWIAAWQIYFKSGVQLHRVRGARAANVDLFERDNAAKLARIIDASIAHAEAPVGE